MEEDEYYVDLDIIPDKIDEDENNSLSIDISVSDEDGDEDEILFIEKDDDDDEDEDELFEDFPLAKIFSSILLGSDSMPLLKLKVIYFLLLLTLDRS